MLTSEQIAAALIGTKSLPAGLGTIQNLAYEAAAYDKLAPYPRYHFWDWKTEDRGPLPRCMPLCKSATGRGARWLFGRPVQIKVPGNDVLEAFINEAWEKNRMPSRLVAIAKRGAIEGGVVLKFSYDETSACPLSIQSLSLVDQVRLYYHPHDRERLLMGRVQYPYFDATDGKTYYYREEWTADEFVVYNPIAADSMSNINRIVNPDGYDGWTILSREPNPFRLIPLTHIKNLDADDVWGVGDLWDLYRVIDRINLTYHLMDKSNQFDSEPLAMFIDLDVNEDDIDKPMQPGQPMQLESTEGKQGKVQQIESSGSLRPAMMEYAKDLRKQVLAAASSVEIDQSEFSNKGNLTTAVLTQLFQPLIEITTEKRKSYGEFGLVLFLEAIACGLSALGVEDLGVNLEDDDTYDVHLQWPSYFELSQDELTALTGRTQEQEMAGYLPHDRAVERIAQAEGIADVDALKEELTVEPKPSPTEADPALTQTGKEISTLTREGGKDSL